jgi:GAF domain-containing protein
MSLHALARHGLGSGVQGRPHDVVSDRTAVAAVHAGRALRASDVAGVSNDDSDVAVPVLDDQGAVLGVLSLRGVAPARLNAADLSDLTFTARWLASALQRSPPVRKARKEATPS